MSKKYQLYIAEREKGKTYQEIADQFGVTRQCVHAACTREYRARRRTYRNLACAYPVLKHWIIDNDYSVRLLYREACEYGFPGCLHTMQNYLREARVTPLSAEILSKITGISSEKLFAISKENEHET